MKPLLPRKIKSTEYIALEKTGKTFSNDKEVGRILNEFFVNIVPNLRMSTNHNFLINDEYLDNHPSILTVKKVYIKF